MLDKYGPDYLKWVIRFVFLEITIGAVGYFVLLIRYKKNLRINQDEVSSNVRLNVAGQLLNDSSNTTTSAAGTAMVGISLLNLRKQMGIKDEFAWLHFLVRLIAYPIIFIILTNSAKVYTDNINKIEENYINYVTQIFEPLGYKKSEGLGDTLYFEKDYSRITIDYALDIDGVKLKRYSFNSELKYTDNVEKIVNNCAIWSDTELSKYKDKVKKLISEYKLTNEEKMFQEIDKTTDCQITFRIEKPSNSEFDYKLYYSALYYMR